MAPAQTSISRKILRSLHTAIVVFSMSIVALISMRRRILHENNNTRISKSTLNSPGVQPRGKLHNKVE
jgi:hypothetical protein